MELKEVVGGYLLSEADDLDAAIAALHAEETRDWPQIAALSGELAALTGSPVVALGRAVAVAEAEGTEAGLAIVRGLELGDDHSRHAVEGDLLCRTGRVAEVRAAYARALDLAYDDVERRLLAGRVAALDAGSA